MEKTDFTLPIELKQHTPILHFQHEQDGAGLRATELKPKLDRLLHRVMQAPKKWLVGHGHNDITALDYKLKIRCTITKDYLVASSIPKFVREEFQRDGTEFITSAPYFADNELIKNKKLDDPKLKRGRMMKNIRLEFFSFHKDLILKIEEWLPVLLAYENFGLRQSKGFGGFFLAKEKYEGFNGFEAFQAALKKHPDYKGALYHWVRKGGMPEVFKKIDSEYKILKGGFANDPSQIMEYFMNKSPKIEWEKRTIKQELVKGRGEPRQSDYTNEKGIKYVRALLGVAELYEFPRDNKEKININSNDIERFRSPITFKIFNETVYLTWHKIPKEIYDAKFTFTNRRGKSISMKTPLESDFNLQEFILNHVENTWNEL